MKQEFFGLFVAEIQEALAALNIPTYRSKQIAEWMYKRGAVNFTAMENLPRKLRELLDGEFMLNRVQVIKRLDSADKKTTKFLFSLSDGVAVETVLMRQHYGNSVCVSTQAGCNMGCVFCASALHGLTRNLTAGEILAQVVHINDLLRQQQERVDTIVIMGSGEPLMNYEAVLRFIHLCHDEAVLGLSYRNITLSTSGIVPMIEKLIQEQIPITLSISLHAPNNEIRSALMPINKKYKIEAVVAAGAAYALQTGRRITYEYILLADRNDSPACAQALANLLRGQLANVNLIPANPVPERGLNRPTQDRIEAFVAVLEKKRIVVTVRKEMGADIQAACGQLRNRHCQEAKQE